MIRSLSIFLLALAGCAAPPVAELPAGVDFSLTRTSPNKHFALTLIPPEKVPLQEIHSWRVKIETPSGKPVTQALVYMNGGMPEHSHGLPTRPAVTREVAPGIYLIEGVKFSMTGWWEILIAAQKGEASDVTSFNFFIEPKAPR
jgi:hypothetical protein